MPSPVSKSLYDSDNEILQVGEQTRAAFSPLTDSEAAK